MQPGPKLHAKPLVLLFHDKTDAARFLELFAESPVCFRPCFEAFLLGQCNQVSDQLQCPQKCQLPGIRIIAPNQDCNHTSLTSSKCPLPDAGLQTWSSVFLSSVNRSRS